MAETINQITLRRFDDMHVHLRTGPLLKEVVPYTARCCGRAIAMPNTRPRAILTAEDVVWYREEIMKAVDAMPEVTNFKPLMTVEIRDNTTPAMVIEAKQAGAVAGKVYPLGVTTNSDAGLRDFYTDSILDTFRNMELNGMLLLLHGEISKERLLVTKREHAFLPTLFFLARTFPKLKIVMEHVSTRVGIEMVRELGPNIAATITAHHLCLTLNDVIGDGIRPHNGCMPMPKDYDDRDVLLEAAMSGDAKFFLGSDSAPHPKKDKESAKGACGVYTAPVLPEVLAEIFDQHNHLDLLENFTSRFGAEFYGLPLNMGTITLVREKFYVEEEFGGVVPFRAGHSLNWKLDPPFLSKIR